MSKIHVLDANDTGGYQVVVHVPMPSGANQVGHAWKDCWLEGESPVSQLSVGIAPGNITQAEYDSISAGDVVELSGTILAESGGATAASLDEMVDKLIAAEQARLKRKYRYYGYEGG